MYTVIVGACAFASLAWWVISAYRDTFYQNLWIEERKKWDELYESYKCECDKVRELNIKIRKLEEENLKLKNDNK